MISGIFNHNFIRFQVLTRIQGGKMYQDPLGTVSETLECLSGYLCHACRYRVFDMTVLMMDAMPLIGERKKCVCEYYLIKT